MAKKLVEQLESHLKIIEKNLPKANKLSFFIVIKGASEDQTDKARKVLNKYHLKDLDERKKVLVFEVYKHPVPGQQGTEDLKAAVKEFDDMGITGVIGSHPIFGDTE